MSLSLAQRFGTTRPVIAMLHFPALPGRPRHNRELGRAHLVDVVGRDLETLQEAGVDGVLFCNEADIPYQLVVGPEIPAAMAAVFMRGTTISTTWGETWAGGFPLLNRCMALLHCLVSVAVSGRAGWRRCLRLASGPSEQVEEGGAQSGGARTVGAVGHHRGRRPYREVR